jgi:hypothetical protein
MTLHHLHSTDLDGLKTNRYPFRHSYYLLLYKTFALLWAQRTLIIPHRKPACPLQHAPRTQRLFIP